MSENKKNSKSNDGGLGLGTAVLLGAGAAAVGFLARDVWNSFQEFQSQSSTSGGNDPRPPPRAPPRSSSNSDWEHKPDEDLETRKNQRDVFGDQNTPDEMKCIVCFDNPREICLLPCRHVCVCENCAEKITDKCPVCQTKIENKKVVYV